MALKREHDPALDSFEEGCIVLRRDGEVAGHVATSLSRFWSPGRPLTMQQWVWLLVVWADGTRERSFEDYPPWTAVEEIQRGVFVWEAAGPHSGEYEVEWLPEGDRQARWAELGITLDDF